MPTTVLRINWKEFDVVTTPPVLLITRHNFYRGRCPFRNLVNHVAPLIYVILAGRCECVDATVEMIELQSLGCEDNKTMHYSRTTTSVNQFASH